MDLRKCSATLFLTLLSTAFLITGCSQGSDIQLAGPVKPTPSQPPSPNPTGPSTSTDSDGRTQVPGEDVSPATPIEPRYRMICDGHYPPFVTAVSSLASAGGFGAGIEIGEPDALGKFDPLVDKNLEQHEHPLVVNLPTFGEARVLFSAVRKKKTGEYQSQSRRIFIADVDISARRGIAQELALETVVSAEVLKVAVRDGISVRSFGVSDGGRFLLIGDANGYKVVDSASLAVLGTVKTGSSDVVFNPTLRESDMVMTVGQIKGRGFASKIYSLTMAADGTLASSKLLSSTGELRRPLVSISNDANDSFAGLSAANRVVLVSAKGASAEITISGFPARGQLAAATAFWRESATGGELRVAVAFESVVNGADVGSSTPYKVEQAFVRILALDETGLSMKDLGTDFGYPRQVLDTIEAGLSITKVLGVSDLQTSPDGKAVFGLFPGTLSPQIYRLTTNGLERVSQEDCRNMSIGVEL